MANLPPVSTIPAANFATISLVLFFATGVNNTWGKFATGINDTGDKFATGGKQRD
jgi:hypothetical protein